ncbi:serine hydrolase [Barrientosiimonas marina]|uniref:Serine hydrolase domain-containing protein n=1 Tax=Lentibacillus kimchii TaxID=1542911 RepID=A0ABW2UU12_9BACI
MKQDTLNHDFEQYCDELLKKYKVPGFSLGLAKEGELFYEKHFGFRDMEAGLALSPDTIFGIGSITKAFTAIAILQLQEKRKLSVNECVTKYLPEFRTPNDAYTKQMTIHHFLTHSSGLPPMPTLMGAVKKSMEKDPVFTAEQKESIDAIQAIDTYAELMDTIAKSDFTLLGPPGAEFSYSNDAFGLLGLIIERVSGKPYEQYVQENILQPAGMHNSGFQLEDLPGYKDAAVLYDVGNQDGDEIIVRSNNPWDAPAMRAAGFLKSTVNDMLKFTEVIQNDGMIGDERILSTESVRSMTTPHIQCEQGTYYGYGLMIIPDFFGYKLIHHGGDMKGVTAQMNILPECHLTGISLANLAGAPSTKLLFGAFTSYLGKSIETSYLNTENVDLTLESLKEFEGTFISDDGMSLEFYVSNGSLRLAGAGLPDNRLKPSGDDQFLYPMREMEFPVYFMRNEERKIYRIAFASRQIPKIKNEGHE